MSRQEVLLQVASNRQSLSCDAVRREFESDVRIRLDHGVVFALVVEPGKYAANQVQPCKALVVCLHDQPWRKRRVGSQQHRVSSVRIGLPVFDSGLVDLTDFPVPQGIERTMLQAAGLRGTSNIEIRLQQLDATAGQRLFEAGNRLGELFERLLRARSP